MQENPYPIAPEGIPFMVFCLVLSVGLMIFFGPWMATIGILGFLFCVWFFRDPTRNLSEDQKTPESVISPADGTIVSIQEVDENRLLNKKTKRISIFMSPLNVHVNRAPVSGKVVRTAYNPGKFFNAKGDKASLDNEQNAIQMKTAQGFDVMFIQIAGFIARRIICYAKKDDQLTTGQRMGLIRFGSRVDVYLPPEASVKVELKDRVRAGQSLLAQLPKS